MPGSAFLVVPSPPSAADPSLSLYNASVSTAVGCQSFDIEPAVFVSSENTGDRVEFFPPIAVGEQVINMKLIPASGNEIPAFCHSPTGKGGAQLLIDWPGTERLQNVDEFRFEDETRTTLIINRQRFHRAKIGVTRG